MGLLGVRDSPPTAVKFPLLLCCLFFCYKYMCHWLENPLLPPILCLLPITCLLICLKETRRLWRRIVLQICTPNCCMFLRYLACVCWINKALKPHLFSGIHNVFVDLPERRWEAMACKYLQICEVYYFLQTLCISLL